MQVKNKGHIKIAFLILLCFSFFQVPINAHAYTKYQPSLGSNKTPTYISEFIILEEGGAYQCRFSLKDEDYAYTTAAGKVYIKIVDSTEKILYENSFSIEKSDFGQYELILTGEDFIAYVWSILESSISKGFSPGKAILTFTSGGFIWEIEDDWITIPEYTEEELIELYEEKWRTSKVLIGETITKLPFELHLESLGEYTFRPYTWGEEETYFRIDISVRNYGSSSEYFWTSGFIIIDSLWNQYDIDYSSTLQSGEMYPGVIRSGYILFPQINPDASTIRIIYTKTGYPDDTVYEFTFNTEDIIPKEPSQITCTTSDDPIVIGNSISFSGSISPSASLATVTLTLTKPDGSSTNLNTKTDTGGRFSAEYQPDSIGSWTVISWWAGNNQYSGSSSNSRVFSVTDKLTSTITCSLSSGSIYHREEIRITGKITPTRTNVEVSLHFKNPDGRETEIILDTDNLGMYSYDYSPSITGDWYISASWIGNTEYLSASSNIVYLSVLELPPTGSLAIQISEETGSSIVGADIRSTSQPNYQELLVGSSDSDGTSQFNDIIVGSYTICISKSGYDECSRQIEINEDEITTLNIILTKQVATMRIYVKDSNAKPIEDAEVNSISQPSGQSTVSGKCNQEGLVTFENIIPGSYTFLASFSGYHSAQESLDAKAGVTTEKTLILEIEAAEPIVEDETGGGGIPGFPYESIILGLIAVIIILRYAHARKF